MVCGMPSAMPMATGLRHAVGDADGEWSVAGGTRRVRVKLDAEALQNSSNKMLVLKNKYIEEHFWL